MTIVAYLRGFGTAGFLMFVVIFNGCIGSVDDERKESGPETFELRHPRLFNVINETLVPGTLEVELGQMMDSVEPEGCSARHGGYGYTTRWSYTLFDRNGFVETKDQEADPDTAIIKGTIPLVGEAPFLVSVDYNFCHDSSKSRFVNVTSGWGLRDVWKEKYDGLTEKDYFFNVTVEQGQANGSVRWEPSPYVFSIGWAIGGDDREGNIWGTIQFVNPHGEVYVREEYGIAGLSGEAWGYVLVPGEYRIELALDQPAIQETAWSYQVRVHEEPPERFCFAGFEWDECQ